MYQFIKMKDPDNVYDHSEITHTVVTENVTWFELVDEFLDFLRGSGFMISKDVTLNIPEDDRGF